MKAIVVTDQTAGTTGMELVDFTVGASLPISGLTAWQALFQHGHIQAGQSVLAHGAAGAVGSIVTQLAREAGAYVIGTGRAADRQKALDFGANEFVDLGNDCLDAFARSDVAGDERRCRGSVVAARTRSDHDLGPGIEEAAIKAAG